MATITKEFLSAMPGSGRPIKVAASATPGTLLHAGHATAKDEVNIWLTNTDTVDRRATIEFGGLGPDDQIKVTVPAGESVLAVPGVPISNSLLVRALAAVRHNVVTAWGLRQPDLLNARSARSWPGPQALQSFDRRPGAHSRPPLASAGVAGTTGKRYEGHQNSVINTNGGGANFFPGNAAGPVRPEPNTCSLSGCACSYSVSSFSVLQPPPRRRLVALFRFAARPSTDQANARATRF